VIGGGEFTGIAIYNDQTDDNVIAGNDIGLDATGTKALGNDIGVSFGYMYNGIGAANTQIVGNVISGNQIGVSIDSASHDTLITGNRIGTNATGTAALGNGIGLSINGFANTIGGTAAGAGNLISGNSGDGVDVYGSGATDNLIEGNLVGTDATGKLTLGNSGIGVAIFSAGSGNTVGGTASGAGNVISGNTAWGIAVETTDSTSKMPLRT